MPHLRSRKKYNLLETITRTEKKLSAICLLAYWTMLWQLELVSVLGTYKYPLTCYITRTGGWQVRPLLTLTMRTLPVLLSIATISAVTGQVQLYKTTPENNNNLLLPVPSTTIHAGRVPAGDIRRVFRLHVRDRGQLVHTSGKRVNIWEAWHSTFCRGLVVNHGLNL